MLLTINNMGNNSMKFKIVVGLIACFILLGGMATAETRTYRQVKDIVVKESGKVSQSDNKNNMFEYTFELNLPQKTITRTKIRRMDKTAASDDKTIYTIMQKQELLGSDAGNGGKVLVAVRKDGGEILELGHRFAFSMRISPFSQVINGIYKRAYNKDHKPSFYKCKKSRRPK